MPTPSDPQFWPMLEAVGTLLAAVVALFGLVYFEVIKPLCERPRLRVEYRDAKPYSMTTDLVLGGSLPHFVTSLARMIRVGVVNRRGVPARGVRVRLSRLAGGDASPVQGFIPYELPWYDTHETRREILAKDEEAWVDLVVGVKEDPDYWWLQPYDFQHPPGFGNIVGLPVTRQPPFIAYIGLVAYAEDPPAHTSRTFRVTYEEGSKLGAFSMKSSRKRIGR